MNSFDRRKNETGGAGPPPAQIPLIDEKMERRWRWLFLCEAAPAVIFGIITFFYLTDRPAQAD